VTNDGKIQKIKRVIREVDNGLGMEGSATDRSRALSLMDKDKFPVWISFRFRGRQPLQNT